MLKSAKNVNLTGQSSVKVGEGDNAVDKVVVYMTATISSDSTKNISVNKNINDQDLYYKNRVEIRKDISDFEDQVYRLEDELLSPATAPDPEMEVGA